MARDERPKMLFADGDGRIYDHPYLEMAGFDGSRNVRTRLDALTVVPEFSKLFYLPGRFPVGYDRRKGRLQEVREIRIGRRRIKCHAVAAFPEPGFARTLLPAADYSVTEPLLPLWAYTAVGSIGDDYVMAAFRVEYNPTWDPANFDDRELVPVMQERLRGNENRLVRHLADCATVNHCFAAKNYFLGRWEAPLPVSRTCNARCLGCLSLQSKESCEASHERIQFRPTVDEVVETALPHLIKAEGAIVSFGQGCEGEPLTEARLIESSVRELRRRTSRGVINLNTNGSLPLEVEKILDAGLDSIRVSLNSARPKVYHAYYRPNGYSFQEVRRSIELCAERGIFTMLNYLIFPGVTDDEAELSALFSLIEETGVKFIHYKNLCIDPGRYLRLVPLDGPRIGMATAYHRLRESFPGVGIGYFNQLAENGKDRDSCPAHDGPAGGSC